MIRIEDIAFVRFRAPDLDAMEHFLVDFGLIPAWRDADALYMRGEGPEPFLHVTRRGAPGFDGVAFAAGSSEDLETLARSENSKIGALDGPGGGRVVQLVDPDGFRVEVVAGREPIGASDPRALPPTNDARTRPRSNVPKRVRQGASHVRRLGHCVLNVSDFRRSESWYKERFGLLTSDEIRLSAELALGAFLRCDRGELPTDHHTLFLAALGAPKFNHAAFEVADFDDLMTGHDHLKAKSHAHEWGIGRHQLGSQIFDYWRDPFGHTLEHWTDGDLMTASWGSREASPQDLIGVQWGMKMPPPVV